MDVKKPRALGNDTRLLPNKSLKHLSRRVVLVGDQCHLSGVEEVTLTIKT